MIFETEYIGNKWPVGIKGGVKEGKPDQKEDEGKLFQAH